MPFMQMSLGKINPKLLEQFKTTNGIRQKSREELQAEIKRLEKQLNDCKKLLLIKLFQEGNPFIMTLDPLFNFSMDLVHMCLEYMNVSYCSTHLEIYPQKTKCMSCMEYSSTFEYVPYGHFKYWKYDDIFTGMLFYNELDVEFITYLKLVDARYRFVEASDVMYIRAGKGVSTVTNCSAFEYKLVIKRYGDIGIPFSANILKI